MKELVEKTVTLLSSMGFGSKYSTLWGLHLPSTPTIATAVVPTGGFREIENPVRKPTIQILHRTTDISSGYSYITSVTEYLVSEFNLICDLHGRFQPNHDVGVWYKDENDFYVFSQNFTFLTVKK